jgi:hypothetical protein
MMCPSMSVRSFFGGVFALASLVFFFASATPALAVNACSFGCTVTRATPTSCTQDTQCADSCAATCRSLGTAPAALPDTAHPSTCAPATTPGAARACTSCTCTPQTSVGCSDTADAAGACRTGCDAICGAYDRNLRTRPISGVTSIACPAGTVAPAPRCVDVPARPGAAARGYCQYSCSFGPTRQVRTEVSCTPSSPSECSTSVRAIQRACTDIGLVAATSLACTNGAGGNKCVANCIRPTEVSADDRGTCNARPSGTADADQCLNRCQQVCGNRGMICNTDGVRCNGGATPARCEFTCAVATGAARQDDRATTCDATQAAGATQLCTARCAAACGERGGFCDTTSAPTCIGDGTALPPGAAESSTSNSGGTSGSASRQPSRTAPVFNVTFPDPFGGNQTLQQIIGNIVRIMVGLCGLFFLAVFVYGGILYLTSAGDSGAVKKGRDAIVNAVIGLVIVLFSYTAVSLIVQLSDQFQSNNISGVDQSQNALDDDPTALRPGGTTRATGRSSQGTETPAPGTTGEVPPPESGTPGAACRSYYRADPATCAANRGGPCPVGVNDLGGLLTTWGRSFPAATRAVPDPAASCRTCLENGIRGLQGANPGLTTSCVPALVNLWSTACHEACNPRSVGAAGTEMRGDELCNPANYNLTAPGCVRCQEYWGQLSRNSTIQGVGCPEHAGKVLIWCAGAESPAQTRRPQSGGYCTFTAPRR